MSIKKILISQPQPESGNSPFIDIASKHGAEVTFRPLIRIESVSTREFRDQRVNIQEHTAVVFLTRKAMEHFFELAAELRLTISEDMKYFCINEQLANYLQKFTVYRKRKVFAPANGKQDGLVALIYKHNKEKYFIPAPEGAKHDLEDQLALKKIHCSTGIMFRTVINELSEEERKEQFDLMILFTPIGVSSLQRNYPNLAESKTLLATQGTPTLQAAQAAGYTVDLAVPSPEYPSLAQGLDAILAKHK